MAKPKGPARTFADLRRAAEGNGWTVSTSRGNHLRWAAPAGGVVFSAKTPSDHRAFLNHLREMRKYGWKETAA